MKAALVIVLVAVCLQLVSCATAPIPPPPPPPPVSITTTTPKSWGTKLKDGLNTFFQGAAVVGAIQGAFANHKAAKHASKPHIDTKPH